MAHPAVTLLPRTTWMTQTRARIRATPTVWVMSQWWRRRTAPWRQYQRKTAVTHLAPDFAANVSVKSTAKLGIWHASETIMFKNVEEFFLHVFITFFSLILLNKTQDAVKCRKCTNNSFFFHKLFFVYMKDCISSIAPIISTQNNTEIKLRSHHCEE